MGNSPLSKRSQTNDILNRGVLSVTINSLRTTNTALSVSKRVNFPSSLVEEWTPLWTSPPMASLLALLGCKEQTCVQSLPERACFPGLPSLLIKTSISYPKDLVLFTVLPQANLVSSVSPLPQLRRPTLALCIIFLATRGVPKWQRTSVPHLPPSF